MGNHAKIRENQVRTATVLAIAACFDGIVKVSRNPQCHHVRLFLTGIISRHGGWEAFRPFEHTRLQPNTMYSLA